VTKVVGLVTLFLVSSLSVAGNRLPVLASLWAISFLHVGFKNRRCKMFDRFDGVS